MEKDVQEKLNSMDEVIQQIKQEVMRLDGICPTCNQRVGNWNPIVTENGKQIYKALGIDPQTGHSLKCGAIKK